MEKLKKPIELKGRVIRYKPVAKLLKNKRMSGGNFKVYNYWYDNKYSPQQKGNFKVKLRGIFNGRFTPDAPVQPSYNSFRHHKNFNQLNQTKKNTSGKFLITDGGVTITDNFPNFEQVQAEIIKAFMDLEIAYDHNPEENIEEINE
jgi:hypothetical protein